MSIELQSLQALLKQTVGYNGKDDGTFDPLMGAKSLELEKLIKDRLTGTSFEAEAKDLNILSGENLVTPINKISEIFTKALNIDPLIKRAQNLLKGKSLLGNSYSGDVDGKMNSTFIRYLQDLEKSISSAANVSVIGHIFANGKLATTPEDLINAVHLIETSKLETQTTKENSATPTVV